jgi:hypothetical protein
LFLGTPLRQQWLYSARKLNVQKVDQTARGTMGGKCTLRFETSLPDLCLAAFG